jgi:hypothetical protein
MDHTAKHSAEKHRDHVKARLRAEALRVLERLERDIATLRRMAPADDESTITGLREATEAIHDAIGLAKSD